MPTLPTRVHIVDVGPRDGLQNEKQMISADIKVELVDRLTDAGFTNIEVTSFVSPKWVPQMGDAAEVMARIRRKPGVTYSVLVPNAKGMEGALAAKADEIVVFAAASEAFSQRNINCSIDESIERFRPVTAQAQQHGIRIRGAISCALGCPYQGDVDASAVAHVARRMKDIGVQHVGVADTIGTGTPEKTKRVMDAVLAFMSSMTSAATFTIPMAWPRPTSMRVSSSAFRASIPASRDLAAARMPKERPETSPPKTCCTC